MYGLIPIKNQGWYAMPTKKISWGLQFDRGMCTKRQLKLGG